jgi:hypothetical protein
MRYEVLSPELMLFPNGFFFEYNNDNSMQKYIYISFLIVR